MMEGILCPRLKALGWFLLRPNFPSHPGLYRRSRSLGTCVNKGGRGHDSPILDGMEPGGGRALQRYASPQPTSVSRLEVKSLLSEVLH